MPGTPGHKADLEDAADRGGSHQAGGTQREALKLSSVRARKQAKAKGTGGGRVWQGAAGGGRVRQGEAGLGRARRCGDGSSPWRGGG